MSLDLLGWLCLGMLLAIIGDRVVRKLVDRWSRYRRRQAWLRRVQQPDRVLGDEVRPAHLRRGRQ